MDALPPPTTMPQAQAQSTTSPSPQSSRPTSSRIPSISENDTLELPSSSLHESSSTEEEIDVPLPAVITSDTIPHLTELLNRPGVRHNEQKRAWVQAKLMDAQLEMKRQRRGRRQRSSVPMQEV